MWIMIPMIYLFVGMPQMIDVDRQIHTLTIE